MGNRDFMAEGLMVLQMARAASEAALLTALDLCPACSRHADRQTLVTGWASGAPSARALTSASAALAARAWTLAARPDFSTPSFWTSATRLAASPRDSFSSADSSDIFMFFFWALAAAAV